jgi:hypothetical protein
MEEGFGAFGIVYFIVAIIVIIAMWKVFEKAGKPGWASLIPIYNIIVMLEIADKPLWWLILFFIPIANIIAIIIIFISIAEKFGQSAGFGLGLVFLGFIFWPILGFGDSQYQG